MEAYPTCQASITIRKEIRTGQKARSDMALTATQEMDSCEKPRSLQHTRPW